MTRMMRRWSLAAALGLVVGAEGQVQGAQSLTYQYQTVVDSPGVGSEVLSFAQFDPALGDLTDVTFTVAITVAADVTVRLTNPLLNSSSFAVEAVHFFTLDAPDLSTFFASRARTTGTLSYMSSDTYGVFFEQGTYSPTQGWLLPSAGPTSIAAYMGTGTFDLTLSSESRITSVTGPGVALSDYSPRSISGGVYLTYTYEPSTAAVPEPATFATAGLGALMGLGYAWRRRRAA